jgi:uncharacterized membrane protein
MSRIEASIDVNVPVRAAYNQWTQFEEFPRFMEGVERVEQLDATGLRWTAKIAGRDKTWLARITEQEPDRAVAWESTEGAQNNGIVSFEELGPAISRVNLALEYEPDGAVESAGDALGMVERRVKGDLERFKEFIEASGRETGGWRGRVEAGREVGS